MPKTRYQASSLAKHPGNGWAIRGTPFQCTVILALCLAPAPALGMDLSSWARHTRQHRQWTSVEFRDPVTGMFLVSRAGTADPSGKATLTLTAGPSDACNAEMVLVQERDSPFAAGVDDQGTVEVQLNGQSPIRITVRIVEERGDRFTFLQFLDQISVETLAEHAFMTVRMRGSPVVRFSLAGFASAWSQARETCEAFVAMPRR